VFVINETAHITLVASGVPVGRLSFGPQPAGRSDVRVAQATFLAVHSTAPLLSTAAMPGPGAGVWSFDDWPVGIVVASEVPLEPAVIRSAFPPLDPRAQYVRSAAERRAGRLATASRFLTLLQEGQPLLARGLIEHRVH
jgi:hypothetical protein